MAVLEMGEAYLKDEKSPVSYFPVGGGVGIQPNGRGGVAAIVAVVGLVSGAVSRSRVAQPRNDPSRDLAMTCGFSSIWLEHGTSG